MFFDKRVKSTLLTSVSVGAVLIGTNALANPEGASVVTGDVAINGLGTDHVIIQNDSNRSIVNWDSFSIGAGETTTINQITNDSAILNRVVTNNVSEIYGTLQSNGKVFLINQSGIVIGASGIVDTNGLVASTLDVSNADFLGAGDMLFKQGIQKGGGIEVHGKIRSVSGGDIFLLSREITIGSTAEISSNGGYVGLGAGEEILLRPSDTGQGRISIRAGKGKIVNQGAIEGAVAELKAAGGNEYALAINNSGVVRATGYSKKGGKIRLGGGGKVRNTGKLVARKKVIVRSKKKIINKGEIKAGDGNKGGEIIFEAPEIEVKTDSILDVSAALGGGRIFVGGGYQGTGADHDGNEVDITQNAIKVTVDSGAVLTASATQSGDAGEIVVWADGETVFAGDIVANAVDGDGGRIEVSGKKTLTYRGTVDASAQNGKAGQLLLDPENITIVTGSPAGVGQIRDSVIQTALENGTSVTIKTGSGVGSVSSVTPSGAATDAVPYTASGTQADGDVTFEAGVSIQWVDGIDGTTNQDTTFTVHAAQDIIAADNVTIQHSETGDGSTGNVINNGGGITFLAGRDIKIGSAGAAGDVAIGSEFGTTLLVAGDTDFNSTASAIDVEAAGNVTVTGSTASGASAQIGYVVKAARANNTGNDKVDTDENLANNGSIIVAASGEVALTGGDELGSFAQIGHGGKSAGSSVANIASNITVHADADDDGAGNLVLTHAAKTTDATSSSAGSHVQIGHGSLISSEGDADTTLSQGVLEGNITVKVGGNDDDASRANLEINTTFTESEDEIVDQLISQIGHGGHTLYAGATVDGVETSHGGIAGNITVNVDGKLTAGATAAPGVGKDQYAIQSKIGHGGQSSMSYFNVGDVTDGDKSFDVVHGSIIKNDDYFTNINVTAAQIDLIAKDAAENSALSDGTLVDNSQQSQIGHGSTSVFNRAAKEFGIVSTVNGDYKVQNTATSVNEKSLSVVLAAYNANQDTFLAGLSDAEKADFAENIAREIGLATSDSTEVEEDLTLGVSLDVARNVTITENRISGDITITDDTADAAGITLDSGIAVGTNSITKDVMITRIGHASVVGVDSLHGGEGAYDGGEIETFNGGNVTIRQAHILGADITVDTKTLGDDDELNDFAAADNQDISLKTSIAAGLGSAEDNTTVAQIGHGGDVFVSTGRGGDSTQADNRSGDGGDITLIRGTVWDGAIERDDDGTGDDNLSITNTTDIFIKSSNEVIVDSATEAALAAAERNNAESSIGHGFKQRLATAHGGSSQDSDANPSIGSAGGAGGDILVYQGLDVREYGINNNQFDDYAYGLRGDITISATNKDDIAINLTSSDTSALSKADFNTDISTIGHGDVLEATTGNGGNGGSGLDKEGDFNDPFLTTDPDFGNLDEQGQVAVYGGRGGHIDVRLGRYTGLTQFDGVLFSESPSAEGSNLADLGDTRAIKLAPDQNGDTVPATKLHGLSLIEGDIFVNVLGGTVNVAGSINNALSPSKHAISESIIGHAQRFTADAGDGGDAGSGNFHASVGNSVYRTEFDGEIFLNSDIGNGSNRGGNGGDVRLTYGDITDRVISDRIADDNDRAEITHDTDADHGGTSITFTDGVGYSQNDAYQDGSSDIYMYLRDTDASDEAQTNADSLTVVSTIGAGLSEANGSVYSNVGHHVRLIGEGGKGGAGGSSNTEFDQDGNSLFADGEGQDIEDPEEVDEAPLQAGAVYIQPNASGGRGGDVLVITNNISGNVVINAARRVTVQAGDGHGGDTIINASIGHTTDLFSATQSGGAAGNLVEAGVANATFDGGIINVGGGQNADNAENSSTLVDSTDAEDVDKEATFAHVLIDGNRDDQFNLKGTDQASTNTNTDNHDTIGEDGIAVTDSDIANRRGSTFASIESQFGTLTTDNPDPDPTEDTEIYTGSADAVIFHDEEGDPQFIKNDDGDFVLNNETNNEDYSDNEENLGRYGRVVTAYDGAQYQADDEDDAFFSISNVEDISSAEGTISLEVFVDMDRDGDVDLVDFDRDGRLDIVDVDRDGKMDVIDGRANYVETSEVNSISGLGVLDYVAVTGKNFNQSTANSTGEAWTNHNELRSDDLLSSYNGGSDSDFVAYVSDFSTANGGRGGDAYSQSGYTSGDISVSTGDNDTADNDSTSQAESLIVKTTAPDATAGNGSDDMLRAIIGHNAVQISDASGLYSAYRVGREGLNMESDEHVAATGGDAGNYAINGNGGRGGNAALIQGVKRDYSGIVNEVNVVASERDHLVGHIFINKPNYLDNTISSDAGLISITAGDFAALTPENHNLVSQIGHSSLAGAAGGDGGKGASDPQEEDGSSQTELADGGDGGQAYLTQNQIKGDITVMAGSDDVGNGDDDFSIEIIAGKDADPMKGGQTVIAQIGHGRQAGVFGGDGGIGDDGQLRGNGGAGGNASLTQNKIRDSVINIDLVDTDRGYDGNGLKIMAETISGSIVDGNDGINDLYRAQVGHGDLGFAFAGSGGDGTPEFNVIEQRNQTANGGTGGDAIVNQAGYSHDIILDIGSNELGEEALQVLSSGGLTNADNDHILATIGHGGLGQAMGGDGGLGGLNGAIKSLTDTTAVDPNLIDGDYFNFSGNDGSGENGEGDLAVNGDSSGAIDITNQITLGTTRRGGDAGDGIVNLNVSGTGADVEDRSTTEIPNDYAAVDDTNGATISITINDEYSQEPGKTAVFNSGYDGVLIQTKLSKGVNQDSALFVNSALVGHHGFADGKGGFGGNAITQDKSATISDGDGGDGGSAIATIGEVRGGIAINNVATTGLDNAKIVKDANTNITISTQNASADDSDEHRGDARVGHMSQVTAEAGAGGNAATVIPEKDYPATISSQGGDGGDALTYQGQQEGNITLTAENSVIVSAKDATAGQGALIAGVGHRVFAEAEAADGGEGGKYNGDENAQSIYFTYEALREFHYRRTSGLSNAVAFAALSEFEQKLVAPVTDYFENKQGELEIFLDRLVGNNANVILHNERDDNAINNTNASVPALVDGNGHIEVVEVDVDDADDGEIETLSAILAAAGHGGNAVVTQGSDGLSGHSDKLAASGNINIIANAFNTTDTNADRGIIVEGVAGADGASFQLGHIGHQSEAKEVKAGNGSDLPGTQSGANGIGGDGGDAVVDQYALNGGIDLVSNHKIKISAADGGAADHETRAWVGHRLTIGSDFEDYREGTESVTAGNGGNEKADSGQDDGHNGNGGDVFIYQRGVISGTARTGSTTTPYDTEISLAALQDTKDDANSITIEALATGATAKDVETHIGHDFLIHGVKAGDAGRQGDLTGPEGASEGLLEGNGGDIFIAQTDLGADIDIVGRDTVNIFANASTTASNHAHLMIGHERTIGNSAEMSDKLDGAVADNPRAGTIVAGFGGDAYTEDVNGTAMASRDAAKLGIIEDADSGRIEIALGRITDSADGDNRLVTITSITEDVDVKSDAATSGSAILEIGNQQQVIAMTKSASEFDGVPKTQTAGDAGGIFINRDTISGDILIQAIDADRDNSAVKGEGKQVVVDSSSGDGATAITQIGHETQFTALSSDPTGDGGTVRAAFGEDRNFLFADDGKLDIFQQSAGAATLGDAQNAVEDMADVVRALRLANENADRYTSAEQTQLSDLIINANDALSEAVTSLNSVGTASTSGGTVSEASAVSGVVNQARTLITAAKSFQAVLESGSVKQAGDQIADFAEGGDIVYGQNLTLTGDNPLNSHTDSIAGVDGLAYVSDLTIQNAPSLSANNFKVDDSTPSLFEVDDTGTVSGNIAVLSGRFSGINSISDLTSVSEIMGEDTIVADIFSAALSDNIGDDIDDSVVQITATADKFALTELGHRRIMKNETSFGGGDSNSDDHEGGIAGDAGSIVTKNTTSGDISVKAEEVVIQTNGLKAGTEAELHLLHSSHTTNTAGWSDIQNMDGDGLLGNGGDIYNTTIVSGGVKINAEQIASALDTKDRKILATGDGNTLIHMGHQAEDRNESKSDPNEDGNKGDTQDNLGSNRGGKIVSSQTVKGNADDDLVIITLDGATDLIIETAGKGGSDIRLGNGNGEDAGTDDDINKGIYQDGISGANQSDDGSEITLTQVVSGDIEISKVEDLHINNAGAGGDENIYIGHDAEQFGQSGQVNNTPDKLQYGERVTVAQTVTGNVNVTTTSSYTASLGADAGELHVGHEATQSGFSADDGPTGDNDSFVDPDVKATQTIEAGISIVTGEITLENLGSAKQVHFGHEATHKAAVDGDQTDANGRSTGHVVASSKINANGSDIRFVANGASGQQDSVLDHGDIHGTEGDIQLESDKGTIHVGHRSTSTMGDQSTSPKIAEGQFNAEQIIGNSDLASNGEVANTANSVIEFRAAQDIILASATGETQVGHYIVETGNETHDADKLDVDGVASTGVNDGDSELRQIVGSDIIFGNNSNQGSGGVGTNGAGNNLVIETTTGRTMIGHQSPASNEWQLDGTRSVTVQLLDGDITVEAGTDSTGTDAPDGTVLDAAGTIDDESGNGDDILIKSAGGTARIGHNMAGQTEGVENETQRSAGDIWVRAGGDLHVDGGAVGHEHYDFTSTTASNKSATPESLAGSNIRNRIRGNTTIAAGQNSSAEDSTLQKDILNFNGGTKAVEINSGYGGINNRDVDGELRFFLPAQQGLTIAAPVTFNDSAAPGTNDATQVRSEKASNVFEGDGGNDHEHDFAFASASAAYTDEFIGAGNFTFYFESEPETAETPRFGNFPIEFTPHLYRGPNDSSFHVLYLNDDGASAGGSVNTEGLAAEYIGTSSYDVDCDEQLAAGGGEQSGGCTEVGEEYEGILPGYGSNAEWSGSAGGNSNSPETLLDAEDERRLNDQVVGFTVYDEPVITTETLAVERKSDTFFNIKTITTRLRADKSRTISQNNSSGFNHLNGFGRTVTNPSPLGRLESPITTQKVGAGVNGFDVSSNAAFSTTSHKFFTGYIAGNDYKVTAVDNTIGTYVDDTGIDAYMSKHAGALSFASSYQVFEGKTVE